MRPILRNHNAAFASAGAMVAFLWLAFLAGCGGPQKGDCVTSTPTEIKVSMLRPDAVPRELDDLARTDHILLLEKCLVNFRDRGLRDYTCLFAKQEQTNGYLNPRQWMDVKFLAKPFSVAMAWRNKDPFGADSFVPQGDMAIYVDGKNDGNMLVRIPWLLGRMCYRIRPDDAKVMEYCLRPINQFGLERGMKELLDTYIAARTAGALRMEFGGYAKWDGRDAIVLIRYLADAGPGYIAGKTVWLMDVANMVPAMVRSDDARGQFICCYEFHDVRFNTGLTESDFLPGRNGY